MEIVYATVRNGSNIMLDTKEFGSMDAEFMIFTTVESEDIEDDEYNQRIKSESNDHYTVKSIDLDFHSSYSEAAKAAGIM